MTRTVSILGALVRAIRPRQIPKNLFLFAALVFSNNLTRFDYTLRVSLAFLLFTLVAGSVYLLNDLLDVQQDRQHPTKRNRPIASGELPVGVAVAALIALAVGGLFLSFLLHPKFGLVVAAYLGLQIAYCFFLKHQVLLDVFTVAMGFVMRVVAGGVVIEVTLSPWLLLCTLQLALFLGFGKRRQELALLGEEAEGHRAILQEYSLPFLNQILTIVSTVTIVCYSVYTIESQSAQQHPHLWLTVPFVLFGIFRYLYLVYQKGWGGAPDEVLLKDRTLQVTIALWLLLILTLFAADRPGRSLFPSF